MITHDQLIYAILQQHPSLQHGVDFWVGQEMEGDTQITPARIYEWKAEGIPEPTEQELADLVAQHTPAYEAEQLAYKARGRRDQLLLDSDVLWLRAQETGQDTTALSAYRQALRDVPQQAGFPREIEWPELP